MDENQTYFTTREAAEFLRYAPATLAVWRCQGRGPVYTKGGGNIRYRRYDLENWMSLNADAQRRLEEMAPCHQRQRTKVKRPRGRAAVAQRERKLAAEPDCRDCAERGFQTLAEEVDHIVRLEDGGTNDDENLRSLCKPCHKFRTRERWTKKL